MFVAVALNGMVFPVEGSRHGDIVRLDRRPRSILDH